MTSVPVLRFAPSPNGPLHLGHALSALTGFDMARRLGGRFLVRIEDIDVARCREEYVAGIFEDLAWLGIAWEEPVLRQSQHFRHLRRRRRSGSRRRGCSTRALPRAARSRRRPRPAPSIPTARRSIQGCTSDCRATRSKRACENGERFALAHRHGAGAGGGAASASAGRR